MSKLTKSEQLLAEKTVCIFMLRGNNADAEEVYAYIAVRADRIDDFITAQSLPNFTPEAFGIVLESGIGTPPKALREKMERDYGFNHDKAVELGLHSK